MEDVVSANTKSRIFFLSFCIQGSNGGMHFGDSLLLATRAKGKEEAEKKFRNWLKKDGFYPDHIKRFLDKKSILEFDELTREKVCFSALGQTDPETRKEEREVYPIRDKKIAEFKEKAVTLFKTGRNKKAVQLYYDCEHV